MNTERSRNPRPSPNEERYKQLESIGNSVAPLYFDARNCSNINDFNRVCCVLNDIASSAQTIASEFSELLYDTLESCESSNTLDDKKRNFREGLETAKQWLYEQKRYLGVSSFVSGEILVAGRIRYENGAFSYNTRKLNLPNLSSRLLKEFLSSNDLSLTKDRISTLGGVAVSDSAKRRIYKLKQKLLCAGMKGKIFHYDSYTEKYTLLVD